MCLDQLTMWDSFTAGLVHYQQNLDCYEATYTISYNNEDPGTQVRAVCLRIS